MTPDCVRQGSATRLLAALTHSAPVMIVSEVGLTTLKPDGDSTSSPIHCEWQRCQQPGGTGCCVVDFMAELWAGCTLNFLWLCGNVMLSHHRWRKAFKPESGCIQNKSIIAAISLITYKKVSTNASTAFKKFRMKCLSCMLVRGASYTFLSFFSCQNFNSTWFST